MNDFFASWAARDLFDRDGSVSLRVISTHDHVMNLWAEEWGHMFMFADPEMYRGPASIGLRTKDFQALKNCVRPGDAAFFRDGRIEFYDKGVIKVSLSAAERIFFSVPPNVEIHATSLEAAPVRIAMSELAAPHLCSCLLADGCGVVADPFVETMTSEFPYLIQSLAQGSQQAFESAASALVGLGCGSTPTGDDLIHGALIALHYLKRTTCSDLPIPSMPRSIGTKTTLLGAHMLELGARGLTAEPVRDFALNLLAGKSIESTFAGLRRMGSDSGCSIAVGLYLTMAEFLDSNAGKSSFT